VIRDNLYGGGFYDLNNSSTDDMPYFWMLSAHQETMWPLTAALNLDRAAKLPFGSAYFFEFYTADGEDWVNTVFRDDKGRNGSVRLDCTPEYLDDKATLNGKTPCKANEFRDFIRQRLAMSNSVSCDQDYNPNGEVIKYADIDKYTDRLLRDIGLEEHLDDDWEGIDTTIIDWIFGYDGANTLATTSAVALAAIVLASF